MKRTIGLDAHSQTCTFVVLGESGKILKQEVVETHGTSLINFVKLIPGHRLLCLEEGGQSEWLYHLLTPHVHGLHVVKGEGKRGNKNDALDAKELADRLRTNRIGTSIYKPPRRAGALRECARSYQCLNRDVTKTKSRIKAAYRRYGLKYPKQQEMFLHSRREAMIALLPSCAQEPVGLLFDALATTSSLKQKASCAMLAEARKLTSLKGIRSVPGMGEIRSCLLVSQVVTPFRFHRVRQFWSYVGLAVVQRSSSDWMQGNNGAWTRANTMQTRGLTRSYNRLLKYVFKGAAVSVIQHHKSDPLYAGYCRSLESGVNPDMAKLTLARKIAAITLAVWKQGGVYESSKVCSSQIDPGMSHVAH